MATVSLPSGSGQSMAWTRRITNPEDVLGGAASTEPGAASVIHSYAADKSQDWALVAVGVRPYVLPGNPSVTFTQAPPFALPFTMAAGAVIAVTNYVEVTAGTMPANPAVTARLSVGDATFLTLSAPAYSPEKGALIWAGVLSSNVTVAAGQAIALSVSNAQPGLAFRIRYDSAACPSKIVLPTSTVIAVPSLCLFDAPYPGGVPVTNVAAGASCYIRATVTDPFGASDITGATLLTGLAGRGDPESLSLDDTHRVSSNAWSKTYECAWDAPAFTAEALFGFVAHEGSEGIQAEASISVKVTGRSLHGFLFIDRNSDQIFNADDEPVTNVTVELIANMSLIAATNSAADGAYVFNDVPLGNVRLRTPLRPGAVLAGIPATASPMRNRAKEESGAAVIDCGVPVIEMAESVADVSAFGVLASESSDAGVASLPGVEPLNFGFAEYPMSTALDLVAYVSGTGVLIDLWTVNEAGFDDIVVYAWIGTNWVEVGRVPSEQVVGEGSNLYTLATTGLAADGAYRFKVIDEAGHLHYSNGEIAVQSIRISAVRLDLQSVALRFNTEPGRRYQIQVSTDLVTWQTEYVRAPMATGWTEYDTAPFMAGPGTQTEVLVPRNGRARAFFKAKRVE